MTEQRSDFEERKRFDHIYDTYLEFIKDRNFKPENQENEIIGIAYIIALNDTRARSKNEFMDCLRKQGAAIVEEEGINWIYPFTA